MWKFFITVGHRGFPITTVYRQKINFKRFLLWPGTTTQSVIQVFLLVLVGSSLAAPNFIDFSNDKLFFQKARVPSCETERIPFSPRFEIRHTSSRWIAFDWMGFEINKCYNFSGLPNWYWLDGAPHPEVTSQSESAIIISIWKPIKVACPRNNLCNSFNVDIRCASLWCWVCFQ